jgi:hypothetical protein
LIDRISRTSRRRAAERYRIAQLTRTPRLAHCLLGAEIAAAAVWLLWAGHGLTFFGDEWDFVFRRANTAHNFLAPHGEHLSVIPIAVYKFLFWTVGLERYWAFRLVQIALHLTIAVTLFTIARRKVGDLLALVPVTLLLFLGPAWEDLLWGFQMGYFISLAAGLGMFVAIERRTQAADVLACVMLLVSLGSSSLGLAFTAAAAVEVFATPERLRRAWVVALPAVLYLAWWLRYGRGHDEFVRSNIYKAPEYVATSCAESIGALTSLGRDWGRPLALVLAFLIVRRILAPPVPIRLWSLLALTLGFWVPLALARASDPAAPPGSSRYLYPGALFVLLLVVELFEGGSIQPRAVGLLAVGVAAVAVANAAAIHPGKTFLLANTYVVRAELGAVEIARDTVDYGFIPDTGHFLGAGFEAGQYLSAVDALGSPAFTPNRITTHPEAYREAADQVLARALRLRVTKGAFAPGGPPKVVGATRGIPTPAGDCVAFRARGARASLEVVVPSGGLGLEAGSGSRVALKLRRFAGAPTAPVGSVTGGPAVLRIPRDRARVPWIAHIGASGSVRVCELA